MARAFRYDITGTRRKSSLCIVAMVLVQDEWVGGWVSRCDCIR